MAFSQVTLGLVFFVRDVFDAAPRLVGLLTGEWGLIYMFSCLFVRPLFNRILPRYLLIASALGRSMSWICA